MTMFQPIAAASDRVMTAIKAGLEIEFGRGAGDALAHKFLDAEEADFRWDARVEERWLGGYEALDDDEGMPLDRIAICGRLDGEWFMATMIVDGDGNAQGVLGCRAFESAMLAHEALMAAH